MLSAMLIDLCLIHSTVIISFEIFRWQLQQPLTNYNLQAHRCLGVRRDDRDGHGFEDCLFSHVKKHDMELDSTDNHSTNAGENGLLTKASQQCWKDLCHVPSTIIFNIIERTSLALLSEGKWHLINLVGTFYVSLSSYSHLIISYYY